jgi:hypothetical protein
VTHCHGLRQGGKAFPDQGNAFPNRPTRLTHTGDPFPHVDNALARAAKRVPVVEVPSCRRPARRGGHARPLAMRALCCVGFALLACHDGSATEPGRVASTSVAASGVAASGVAAARVAAARVAASGVAASGVAASGVAASGVAASALAAPVVATPVVAAPRTSETSPKPSTFGRAIAATETVSLADIAKNPGTYKGKVVTTQGKVTRVCQERGCWMAIQDEAGSATVRMHGHSFFVPTTSAGKHARVEGTVVLMKDGHECDEMDAVDAKLELDATGVELM